MHIKAFQKAVLLSVLFFFGIRGTGKTQETSPFRMEVTTERHPQKENLLDMMVKIFKTDSGRFDGYLKVLTPTGFSSMLGDSIPVSIASGSKNFIPLKILTGNDAIAGDARFLLQFFSQNKQIILTHRVAYSVAVNAQLNLYATQPIINLYNTQDTAQVEVAVSNTGNIGQEATIVFNIPEMTGEKNFFEYKGFVERKRDTVFKFRFPVSEKLLQLDRFTVLATGLCGPGKDIFGNASFTILNVSSSKRYRNVYGAQSSSFYQSNSVTASYRRMENNIGIYQLMGNMSIDLPAGYISMNGNLYAMSGENVPTVSNTYLSYVLNENEIKAGNITQTLEMPFFGRGAEVTLKNKAKSLGFQAGFVDESFNLVQKNRFLKNNYGFYAIGMLNHQNTLNNYTANYMFKEDVYENAMHHVAGGEIKRNLGKAGDLKVKIHEGYSEYRFHKTEEFSTAIEVQHFGDFKTVKTVGNYFYSTKYFPGNRRGVTQLQQTVTKALGKTATLYTSFFISDFNPRSHTYNVNIRSNNVRADAGITLPRPKNLNLTLAYQYQQESSNGFNQQQYTAGTGTLLSMHAHRFVSSLNLSGFRRFHSFILGAEGGAVQYPQSNKNQLQFRLSSSYSFKAIHFNAVYQHGSYFLSEYAMAKRAAVDTDYQRLMFSLNINQPVFNKKLLINAGASYINDYTTGKTPAAFINLKYVPEDRFFVFLNTSWFRYDLLHMGLGVRTASVTYAELGFTFNFKPSKASPGKKGTIKATVYYDYNNNNVFDKADSAASHYTIVLNNTSFQTDANGQLQYRSVPFGKYQARSSAQQGWFSAEQDIILKTFKAEMEIPLHQSGTISGKIQYDVDIRTALHFTPRFGGIIFNIYNQDGKLVEKASTNEDGEFMSFLPTGNYRLIPDEKTLPENTFVADANTGTFTVISGKITVVPAFTIKAKEKKKIIKKFGE